MATEIYWLLEFVLILWGAWVLANVTAFILGVLLVRPDYPQWNGFKVYVPPGIRKQLSEEELRAVVEHELGHKAHWHVWKNLARICCCMPASIGERIRQEYEADDYVAQPAMLASALRKLSQHPFDLLRASRLELIAAHGRQEAGYPTSGMDVSHL